MYLSLHSNGLLFKNTASGISETSISLCKMYCDSKINSYETVAKHFGLSTTGFRNFRAIECVDN